MFVCSFSNSFTKRHKMAKQKICPTRLGDFSGVKRYMQYVKVLKKRYNAVGRFFCDTILMGQGKMWPFTRSIFQ